jgi:L-iditol 2-dehydrogenase
VKIAVLRGPRRFEIVEEPSPVPGEGEVLVEVGACGICASDLPAWAGDGVVDAAATFPRYLGHEVAGTVEAVGPGVGWPARDDRVAVWVTEHGFAEQVVVPADRCAAAGEVPLDLALGEPLGCAVNAVELASPRPGDDVAIVGAGFMGNLVQLIVDSRGARQLIVADMRADALERAKRLGATRTVDVRVESLADVVADLTTDGADLTFEATGTQAGLDAVGPATRMSGTIAIVGFHQGEPRTIPLGTWNWMAYRIANAHFREPTTIVEGMRRGMRLLTSGRLSLDGLVTDRFPLERIDEGFRMATERPDGFVKATVIP